MEVLWKVKDGANNKQHTIHKKQNAKNNIQRKTNVYLEYDIPTPSHPDSHVCQEERQVESENPVPQIPYNL